MKAFTTFVIVLAVASVAGCVEEDPAEKARREKYGDTLSAFVMAKDFVQNMLKSPGTADFGWQTYDKCVTDMGEGVYLVNGWVDAQNSFGGKVRADFIVRLKYVGNDKWRAIEGPYLVQR